MPVIKRYSNRKLYDTEAKRYVTLEGIAELIRQGVAVSVVDHASGDDLTAQIQAQIIFEAEKRRGGRLPATLLNDLIQTGSQKLQELRQALTPAAGPSEIEAEIERRVTRLVERGDLDQAEGLRLLDLLLQVGAPPADFTDAEVERILHDRGLPSRQEMERIARRVDSLQAEIDQLLQSRR